MVETLLKTGYALLMFLGERERNRFSKDYRAIKEELYEELKKPSIEDRQKFPGLKYRQFRDNAVIDDCSFRLRILCESITAASGKAEDLRDF